MSAEPLMSPEESAAQKSNRVGREYVDHVVRYYQKLGFVLQGKNVRHASHIEQDLVFRTPDGRLVAMECKGSDKTASSPGMERTDNYWKVSGYVGQLERWRKYGDPKLDIDYMLVTSHLPNADHWMGKGLNEMVSLGNLKIVCIPFPTKEHQ
jgi:hypothetical protein